MEKVDIPSAYEAAEIRFENLIEEAFDGISNDEVALVHKAVAEFEKKLAGKLMCFGEAYVNYENICAIVRRPDEPKSTWLKNESMLTRIEALAALIALTFREHGYQVIGNPKAGSLIITLV